MMTDPSFSLLMRLQIDVGELLPIGGVAQGERRVVHLQGGTFEGAGFELKGWRGVVLPGGSDWQLMRSDGVLEVDARYVLQDDAGQRVQVASQGVRHGPAEVMAALALGEAVDPGAYYFRTAMRFETGVPALAHLNRVIAFGIGTREARCVKLQVFALR
jgi:hypothetical protein